MNKAVRMKEVLSWWTVADYLLLVVGALVQAFALRLFLVPSRLLTGGVSGIAQIINSFTGWPIGAMVIIGNLPLFFIGWRYLGGARFAMRTGVAIIAFSIFTDFLVYVLPEGGLMEDLMLASIFGGAVFGVGLGFVYRAKGTSGGSDILGQILYHRKGVPMTQAYFAVDALVLLAEGAVRLLFTLPYFSLVMPQAAHKRLDNSCSKSGVSFHFRMERLFSNAFIKGKSRSFCGSGSLIDCFTFIPFSSFSSSDTE